MSADIDPKQAINLRLGALSLENYRKARWSAVDAARTLGLTWAEIATALGMGDPSAARRLWVTGKE